MLKNNLNGKPIIISAGEPAGIGPDLVIQLSQLTGGHDIVVCADKEMLIERAKLIGIDLHVQLYDPNKRLTQAKNEANIDQRRFLKDNEVHLTVLHMPLQRPVVPGQLNAQNSQSVVDALVRAAQGCLAGEFSALLTAPIHKGIINDAGIPFSGHTELLAELAQANQVVMVLATDKMRVALATTHLPLKEVSSAITQSSLTQVISTIDHELKQKYHIPKPVIYVCGLNPHAGEGGHLGREEIEVITPVIETLNRQGMNLIGPMPADTVFQAKYLDNADMILAMYHDQGLPVLKYQGFGEAVNITFGLPFIRISVDHGTALDLAGTSQADAGSILTAYRLIRQLLDKQ